MMATKQRVLSAITIAVSLCVIANITIRNTKDLEVTENVQRKLRFDERLQDVEKIQSTELGLDTNFIYGIFSMRSETDEKRRQMIRETYLKDPRYCPLSDLIAPHDMTPASCFLYYSFVVAGGGDDAPTDHGDDSTPIALEPSEDEKMYGDIVVLNIKENMEEGKSQTWFKYAASLALDGHRIDYVGKMDSDTMPDVDGFIEKIKNDLPAAPYNRRIYGGSMGGDWRRDGLYGFGQFYFMSTDLAHYISMDLTAEERNKLLYGRKIEDTDIAHLIHTHSLPVRHMDLRQWLFWAHPLKEEEKWMKTYENGVRGRWSWQYLPVWNYCRFRGYKPLEL